MYANNHESQISLNRFAFFRGLVSKLRSSAQICGDNYLTIPIRVPTFFSTSNALVN